MELYRKQTAFRERVHKVFQQNYVQSGLYQDEPSEAFPLFVRHVRQFLSQSPRTVLRQALHQAAFEEHNDKLHELCRILKIPTEEATMHAVVTAMESLSPGKSFRKLNSILKKLERPCWHETDPSAFREKIAEGIYSQNDKNDNQEDETSKKVDDAVNRAVNREQERRIRLQEEVASLTKRLETDHEYQVYNRAQRLYCESGAKQLWENYVKVDLVISKKRCERGQKFEKRAGELCFSMIVFDLSKSSGEVLSDISYQRNVSWWHDGQMAGEIDLAVVHDEKVVAICEMKTSCFEIGLATRQHRSKLRAAATAAASNGSSWSIGPTCDQSYAIAPGRIPEFYFCTILPEDDELMVGAEPRLVKAICEGIRSQGFNIASELTVELCQPVAKRLLKSPPGWVHESFIYLRDGIVPTRIKDDDGSRNDDIDYERLLAFLQKQMKADGISESESPASCLRRIRNNMLVLTR